MNPNEINFSFDGRHCLRDFGCVYVEKGGHTTTGKPVYDEHEIAGASGTVMMDAPALFKPFKLSGTLYKWGDIGSQREAQHLIRRLSAWLSAGRKPLKFDYEPGRYYMAQLDGETKWDYAGWIDGGQNIAFRCQPFAYNVRADSATATTNGGGVDMTLVVDTGQPAPVEIEIANTGSAPITGVTVTMGGKTVTLAGMEMADGASLLISMEPPVGALFSGGVNALSYATRFDILRARPGANAVSAVLTYGEGDRGARVTATARGRFV